MEVTSLRTFVGSVACIDLVGYSKLPVDRQIDVKKRFNARLTKAMAGMPAKDRVMLDTGDGVLIGFLGDPEHSFTTILKVRDAIDPKTARIGVHLGSVKLLPGVSGDVRLVGDTASIAERIAAFAEPGEIVVSRALHSMVSRLSDQHEALFRSEGVRTDKQGQEHEIFVVDAPERREFPVAVVASVVAVVVMLAAVAWVFVRKPAPPVAAKADEPAGAMKGEASSLAAKAPEPRREPVVEAKRELPPVETKRELPVPTEIRREPPPEPKRPAVARNEPRPAPSTPASQPAHPPAPPSETRKFFSGLWSGTKDMGRAVGSAFSAPKENAGSNQAAATGSSVIIVSRPAAEFPQEAASQGISSGKVRARLSLNMNGYVTHVTILTAEPPGYFEREATRTFERWRFNAGPDGRTYEADLDFKR